MKPLSMRQWLILSWLLCLGLPHAIFNLVEGIQQRMAEEVGVLDPQEESGALQMAAAVVVYLTHRRDEFDEAPADILRLTARAEFDGHPPANVAQWLEEAGVEY